MKAKHLGKALWYGFGGALMGAAAGCIPFWLMAAAGIVSGTVGGFLLVAALPIVVFAYREGIEAYRSSRQNARASELAGQEEKPPAKELGQTPDPAPEKPAMHYTDKINAERAPRSDMMPAVSAASYRR